MSSKGSIPLSFIVPGRMLFFMWLIFFVEMRYGLNLSLFGILPRELYGLFGILFAPLLHASLVHLVSNTFPFLFLGITLYYFYGHIGKKVFLICYFIPNVLVWLFARNLFHIGSSGLIYGMASFLFFSGLVRKELKSTLVGVGVALAYGGLVWGILPSIPGVSWETHLFGAVVGAVSAFYFRGKKIK